MTRDTTLEEAANDLEMAGGASLSATADMLRRIELERADAARRALEEAARKTEELSGNRHYQSAFKLAARTIRNLKPA